MAIDERHGMKQNKKKIIYEQYERWSIEQKREILMASSNFVQNNKHNFINYGRALLFYWNGFAVFWTSHFHLIPFILIAIVTINFYIRIVLSATLLMTPASRLKSLFHSHFLCNNFNYTRKYKLRFSSVNPCQRVCKLSINQRTQHSLHNFPSELRTFAKTLRSAFALYLAFYHESATKNYVNNLYFNYHSLTFY